MPTIITHGVAGFLAAKISGSGRKLFILSAIAAMIPDLDALAFKFHIAYSSDYGHRGFSHSILFSLVIALILYFIFMFKDKASHKARYVSLIVLFLAGLSHPVLDAMTDGGLGVAFFYPFSGERFFFPFRFIPVAPIAIKKFLSSQGMSVLFFEIIYVWLPLLVINYIVKKVHIRKRNNIANIIEITGTDN